MENQEQEKPNGPDPWADTYTGTDQSISQLGTTTQNTSSLTISNGDIYHSRSNSSDVRKNLLSQTSTEESGQSNGESLASSLATTTTTHGMRCRLVIENGTAKIVLELR